MRKTSKAVLSQAPLKLSAPVEDLPDNTVTIIDAMSIVQKVKGNHKTFGERKQKNRCCIDVYRDISIKNI